MANKETPKVPINRERFFEVLKKRGSSIRKLGEAYDQIQRTEKTIRRSLDEGKMPPDTLDRIARYLNVHPDYLSGAYDDKADRIEDQFLKELYKRTIDPDSYPYLLKSIDDIDYSRYFEDILTMNHISMEQFKKLDPVDRVLFRQQMVVAILSVIAKYFPTDSLGHSTEEDLEYYKAFVDDFDPFSYFAELEGIGLSMDDLDDTEMTDQEDSLYKKYFPDNESAAD